MVYKAPAINFNGSVSCINNSLVATNSGQLFCSFWLKASSWPAFSSIWTSDPNNLFNFIGGNFSDASDMSCGFFSSPTPSTSDYRHAYPHPDVGSWDNYIMGFDMNHAAGSRVQVVYQNGVKIAGANTDDQGVAFTINLNGLEFVVGDDTFGDTYHGLMANFYLNVGNNYLTSGDFSPATIALFYDSVNQAAVDPAIAIAALGTPTICLTGDPAHFPQNSLGSGGAFTVTGGTLTQSGFAPFPPSAPLLPTNVNTNQLPLFKTGFFPNRR